MPIRRPTARRRPAAALGAVGLATTLALAGCTSGESGAAGSTSPTAGTPGAAGTATSSSAAITSSSPATTSAVPTTAAPTGAETPEAAAQAVAGLLRAQSASAAQLGAAGTTARGMVYAGDALVAANARVRLVSLLTADQKADLALSPDGAVVLGQSRGPAFPRLMVAKAATAKSGNPVLLLLVRASEQNGYQIAHQAYLLPGQVGALDKTTVGSPPLAGLGGLVIAPDAFFATYAAALAFPAPATQDPAIPVDPFFGSIRDNATKQATSLRAIGTVTQVHTPKGDLAGLQLPGGKGVLVFGVLDRKETVTETTPNALNATPAFKLLSGKSVIDKKAVLGALEFLVVEIPVGTGQPRVVAAQDQLVSASGS
ncbi:MAG TPA: hypothetical protein P5181_07025 [Dermatophilaceae bacterium]|nr:hypothetical protein [Dermatophilaceae bacterium]